MVSCDYLCVCLRKVTGERRESVVLQIEYILQTYIHGKFVGEGRLGVDEEKERENEGKRESFWDRWKEPHPL